MSVIAVYRFEVFDKAARAWAVALYRATREHIDEVEGAVHLGSKMFVDSLHVENGIYRPPPRAGSP